MEVQRSKILITGGTGLIGQSLKNRLIAQNQEVNILSRQASDPQKARFTWDPGQQSMDLRALKGIDTIVNLAGSSIAGGLWTKARKKEILKSRLDAIQTLATGLIESKQRPRMIIQASAIGIYGHRPGEKLNELSSLGQGGFLTETVQKWEEESEMLRPLTDHLVHVRLGLVLSKSGGMWPPMTMSSKLGFLNWFGNGRQVYSWIHLEDVAQSIWFILQQNHPSNLYNLTSPHPVSQKEIIQIASKSFPSVFLSFGIPAFLVRLAPFGMSELVLTDSKIFPSNLLSQNYKFKYSDIQDCIQELISNE